VRLGGVGREGDSEKQRGPELHDENIR